MPFIKKGETTTITAESLRQAENVKFDPRVLEEFCKVAGELKQIAPKADDFLYFAAVMMHAAEASLLNDDGTIKKSAKGDLVTCSWDKGGETWKWVCSDDNIRPYKNSNNDIFPEEELIKAHKKWVGRPLCIDHKSDSVDHVRGVVVDTYYDYPKKRVIALCALDKVNHPELARNVKTGVAACVSMGTAVGRAICTDCGKVAKVEADFCQHMKNKSCYGEINLDLNPIELSIVVNGADPAAKIKHIIASAENAINSYETMKERLKKEALHSMVEPEKVQEIEDGLSAVMKMVEELKDKTESVEEQAEETKEYEQAEERGDVPGEYEQAHDHSDSDDKDDSDKEASNIKQEIAKLASNINELREDLNNIHDHSEENQMTQKNAYFQGGGGVNEPTPGKPKYEKEDYQTNRDKNDKQMTGAPPFPEVGGADGLYGDDLSEKKKLLRAELEERALKRAEAVERAKNVLRNKSAYFQGGGGVNEPTPGKAKYPVEDYVKYRDKEDKQMVGAPPFPEVGKTDGLYGDDLGKKQKLLRAKLNARFYKTADVVKGGLDKSNSHWKIFADDQVILTASVNEITRGNVDGLYESVATPDFGRRIMSTIRTSGYDKAHELFKGAQAPGMEAPPAEAPAEAPGPGAEMPPEEPAAELPEPGEEEEPMLEDTAGDPGADVDSRLEQLEDLATELQNLVPDFREAVSHIQGEPSDELAGEEELEGMEGEEMMFPEEGGEGEAGLPAAAAAYLSPATRSLFDMKGKLKVAIATGMEETLNNITEHLEELSLAKNILSDESLLKNADSDKVDYLVTNATADARDTLSEAYKLMEAFVRYAHGTDELEKRAAVELRKVAQEVVSGQAGDPLDPTLPSDAPAKKHTWTADLSRGDKKGPDPLKDPNYLRAIKKANRFKGLYHYKAVGKITGNVEQSAAKFKALKAHQRLTDDELTALLRGAWAKQGTKLADTLTPEEIYLMRPQTQDWLRKIVPQPDLTNPSDDGGPLDANAAKATIDMPGGQTAAIEATPQELKDMFSGAIRSDLFVKEAADRGKCTCTEKCKCKGEADKCIAPAGKCPCKMKEEKKKKGSEQHDLNTKEGRMAYRAELEAKLAAKSKGWSDMLQKAHPKGGETTQLDVKPSGDLARVERLDETHDAMMDVATAPPRIRKLASDIQKFVEAGQINPDKDFPELEKQGLDPAAIKYWKQFYGQAKDGGSQFAAELVKEHHTKKAEDEKSAYRVKVARAYDLAHEMVRRGLIRGERSAINEQVSDILSWSDDSFNSMQRVVEMQPLNKQASAMPQVAGNSILDPGERLPAPKAAEGDLVGDLQMAFANRRY